ncbi:MAG: methionyl-tRNA formyltransferase [Candidatus Tritonobacter lacicola]|nr:methionyl-tRNA formyltransferase [Candidatus Tritonobacter lacicola]
MRIVFMGTPDFAVPSLKALVASGHEVAGVVTQPDRPRGRKLVLTPPPVKKIALDHGIKVLQPKRAAAPEFVEEIESLMPDLVAVVAYGKILKKNLLDIPKYGCVNVHASLLPKYRGASPIQHAIMAGERTTGVTTMFIDEGMDTGDIILQHEVPIADEDTSLTMWKKLSDIGAELLMETVELIAAGRAGRNKQADSLATYAPMLKKEEGEIDWSLPAEVIRNRIRGMPPWPGAYTHRTLKGRRIMLKLLSGKALPDLSGEPGSIIEAGDGGLVAGTGEGALLIERLQAEGGRPMDAAEFLRGHRIMAGEKLG